MAGWLQAAAVIALVGALHVPLGDYMARAFIAPRHWALLAVAGVLFTAWMAVTVAAESHGSGTAPAAAHSAMEGKETAFGVPGSAAFGVAATSSADGAANASYDSFTALGGGLLMSAMMLGEVSPGGVGSGLYGLLMIALVAVFLGGLMVSRTPTYLRKRIRRPR